MRFRLLWILTFLLIGSCPSAQPMQIQHLTVRDGLSQNSPYHMLKDSRGFLWLGTQDGVNRFDGHRFRVYRPDAHNPHALRGVNVGGIVEDKQGNVWVGTEEGLNRYDRATDRFSLYRPSARKRRVSPFHATETELWFTSEGQGIMAYNFKSHGLRRVGSYAYINRDFDFVDWTTYSPSGDVWLQAPKGLIRFNVRRRTYHHYFTNTPRNEYGEPFDVHSFVIDKDDVVWLGTDRGLLRFDHRRKKHRLYAWTSETRKLGVVFSLAADANGQLWLGTQRNGLWIFDKKDQAFRQVQYRASVPVNFKNYDFHRVYVDNSGIVWANSDPEGLVKIVPNASMFGYIGQTPAQPERSLSDQSVRSLAEDGRGRIWVGTERGLDILDRKSGVVEARYFTDQDNILKSIFRDSRQRMWVGTYDGLMLFDRKKRSFETFTYQHERGRRIYTRNILELPDHRLLLGTQLGMWIFDPVKRSFERVPHLASQNIFATFFDQDGTLWLGSYFDRLYGFKINKEGWKKCFDGFKDYNINAMQEDTTRKILWIATEKGLLAYYKYTRKYRLYDENDGLANSYIYGLVVAPDGGVFVSTNHGISGLEPATGRVRNFDLSDGLQGLEFNANAFLKTASGECYFGGVKGLNYFYPKQFQTLSYQPRIHLYNFLVNEEPYDPTRYVDEIDMVTLPHDRNTFSLEFASIDYYSNGKNEYRYLLEGEDQEWVASGSRTYARYANLAPGQYVFKVKSANRDGVWSDQERRLYINIKSPFWRTWWFTAFYLLLIAGTTFVLSQKRIQNLSRKQREHLKIALDAQEQERRSIAQDLHDEVGSRLATLKLYVSSLTNYLNKSPESDKLKQEVFDIIHISLVDIRRLLRELSPRTLEQYGYVAAVEELVGKINASDQLYVTFECRKLIAPLPETIGTGLYRITQELLNNSLKHAEASEIVISVIPSGKVISFFYSDNGRGFDFNEAKKGLGISNVRSRVAVLEGQMKWFTKPGAGLEVTIEIPSA